MTRLAVLWCILRHRHKGRVDFTYLTGAYWMCDNCGLVVKG